MFRFFPIAPLAKFLNETLTGSTVLLTAIFTSYSSIDDHTTPMQFCVPSVTVFRLYFTILYFIATCIILDLFNVLMNIFLILRRMMLVLIVSNQSLSLRESEERVDLKQ